MLPTERDYPHHLLLLCLAPLPTEVRHMPRKCDEDTCLAALQLFLSQPCHLFVATETLSLQSPKASHPLLQTVLYSPDYGFSL